MKNKLVEKNVINQMLHVIKHGGPDAEGIYVDSNIGLGHCRLSIVDLWADGTQPMKSSDGQYVISFTGEIYNYNEIRNALEKRVSVLELTQIQKLY